MDEKLKRLARMNSIINTDLVVVVGKTKLITREFETIVLNCQLINLGRADFNDNL